MESKKKINYDIEPMSFKIIKGLGVALVLGFVIWLIASRDTSRAATHQDLIGTWTQQKGSSTGILEISDDGSYTTRVEGEYAAHLQFTDFAKRGHWTWQNNVFVVGDDQGVTIKSFNAKCVNNGKKLRLEQVDYNYFT